jgi:hypothetical protein
MTSLPDTAAKPATRWRPVDIGDQQALAKARAQTINIVQWLARIANSYAAARAPEDRVLLEFHTANAAFVTKTFDDGLALEMRLPTLKLQFLEKGRPSPHIFDPEEHSPADAEAWLLVELLHRGVDRSKFTKKLPHSIPDLMSGDAEDYSPQSCREGLSRLMAWFQNAATILEAAAGADGNARVFCWPQTLELSCVADSGLMRTGSGFSPGDGQCLEPYFYKNTSARNGSAGSSKRSILKACELLAKNDPTEAAIAFLQVSAAV